MAIVFNGNAATGVQSACIGPPSQGVVGAEYPAAVVQTGGGSTAATFATAIQQGDAIVVCVAIYGASATITNVSDGTNTYALLESESATTSPATAVYGCISTTAFAASGCTVTVTFGTLPSSSTICLARYTGPGGCGFFDPNVNDATGTTGGTSVSLTTQFFSEMLVNFAAGDAVGTAAVAGTGFTGHQASPGSGLGFSYLLQDQLLTAPTTTSATATGIASAHWSTISIGVVAYCGPRNVLPSSGCCFVYVPSGGSAINSTICEIDNIANSPAVYSEINSLVPELVSDGFVQGTAITTGTWWLVCWRISGAAQGADGSQIGRMPVGASEIRWATLFNDNTNPFSGAEVCVGILNTLGTGNAQATQSDAAEMSVCGLKIWSNNDPNVSAWLTDADFVAESRQIEPARKADLWAYWSFAGNGSTGQLVAEQGSAAGMTLVPFSSAQISFGQDPQIPRYRPRRFTRHRGSTATAVALAVAIVGQATVADAVNVTRTFASAIVGGATLTMAAKIARAIAMSASGQASMVDAISVKRVMAEVIAGAASEAASIKVARPIADAVSGDATLTASTKVARALADSLGAKASVTAAANLARALLDAISGAASLGSTVKIARAMQDAIEGAATMSDALNVARPLAESIAAHSVMVDTLAARRPLAWSTSAAASATLTSTIARPLILTVGGEGVLVATLTVQSAGTVAVAAAIVGGASLVAAVNLSVTIQAAVAALADLQGSLGVKRPMSTSVAGQSALAALLGRFRPMVVTSDGFASLALTARTKRGVVADVEGEATLAAQIATAAGLSAHVVGSSPMAFSLARATTLIEAVEAYAQIAAGIVIGNGPIGPMRIAASDLAIIAWSQRDFEIVAILAADMAIVPQPTADLGAIEIASTDSAIVTITATDGPPT
jgi:hypothetical protein